MKAELINDADPRWASFLRNSHHDFYHLPAYAALSARQEGGDAAALLVGDGTGTMLLPIVLRSIQGSRLDAVSPYGYPGSLVSGTDDPSFADRALHAGLDLLRSAGVVSLFVRLHPLLNPVPPKGHGRVALHGSTVSVDLTLPSEVLWRQMRENHRRDIRRALKTGLRPAFDDSWTHFETFKRLYRATMDRVSAEARYYFDDRYFDELRSALQERLKLCVVEVDGVIAGAGLFVETCGIVQYHLSGTDNAFTGGPPTKLMLQFVGEWARTRGDIRLHLGGGIGATDDSLFDFKAGFSPDRHAFHTWRSVLDEAEYARLESLRGGRAEPRRFLPVLQATADIVNPTPTPPTRLPIVGRPEGRPDGRRSLEYPGLGGHSRHVSAPHSVCPAVRQSGFARARIAHTGSFRASGAITGGPRGRWPDRARVPRSAGL